MLLPLPDQSVPRGTIQLRNAILDTPYTQVYTARGCIHHCPYCPVPALRPGKLRCPFARTSGGRMEPFGAEKHIKSIHVEDDIHGRPAAGP